MSHLASKYNKSLFDNINMKSISTLGICLRASQGLAKIRPISLLSTRSFANLTQGPSTYHSLSIRSIRHNRLESRYTNILNRNILPYNNYSTGTTPPPPPPPPPPHDKNAKGKFLFNRIGRAFTFSLSSVIVLGATCISVLVVYLILSELFLPSGDTRTFNKAVRMLESNELAHEALGFKKGQRVKAHGEQHADKWARNRPAQSVRTRGTDGKDYLFMKFQVESPSGKYGTVTLEQVDRTFWSSEFLYIALDMPGNKRIYIKEPKFQSKKYVPKVGSLTSNDGFLGLKWGPKKDD